MIRFLQTPGPLKKIILGGLLLIICAAMVITLIPGGVGSSLGIGAPGAGIVATVMGDPVTAVDVQRQARGMLQQQFPQGGAQMAALLPYFAQRAAETLIQQKLIVKEARELGLRATDDEVRDELQHGRYSSVFFPNGTFIGQSEYEALLQQHDLTVPMFEDGVKDQILLDKLRSLIAGSASVTDADVRQEFQKRNVKVKLEYAVLSKDTILKGIHPTDGELKAFYDRNQASYKNSIPEKRKIQYVVLDSTKVASQIQVTTADLQAYYDQHREEYRTGDQVNVRHILIKTPLPDASGKIDPNGVEAARKKAEDVLKQVKAGGDFSKLAAQYSEDTASAKNGGSIGWIGRGRTVPEFEKAAFGLPKGGTSDLVQSSYGFHIIHVDDKQEAHLKTLSEMRPEIEPVIKQIKASQALSSQADAFLAQAKNEGLEKTAAARGLEVVSTGFVGRTDALPGIGPAPQFMDAVFNAGDKSPAEESSIPQGMAIFHVESIQPPATPTFEEVKSKLEDEFKNQQAQTLLGQKTQELSDRAKADHDLQKAAKELGAIIKTSDFVAPDGQVPDIGSMSGNASVAFTMKTGDISGPIEAANNGVVLTITDRQEPTDADYAVKKDQIRDSLLQNKQAEMFGMFVMNLHDQMQKSGKIKINQDEMNRLTRAQGGDQGE
ncbi:MAG: peptidyl-prolyl cis-trans isomerase [Terriglobales bacterium]|jgi:peptidyl-prolyl cis-trans isomerase D